MSGTCDIGDGFKRWFRGMGKERVLLAPVTQNVMVYVCGCHIRYVKFAEPKCVVVRTFYPSDVEGIDILVSYPDHRVYAFSEDNANQARILVYKLEDKVQQGETRMCDIKFGTEDYEVINIEFTRRHYLLALISHVSGFNVGVWKWDVEEFLMEVACGECSPESRLLSNFTNGHHWVDWDSSHVTFYEIQPYTENNVIRTSVRLPASKRSTFERDPTMGQEPEFCIVAVCFFHSGDCLVLDKNHELYKVEPTEKVLQRIGETPCIGDISVIHALPFNEDICICTAEGSLMIVSVDLNAKSIALKKRLNIGSRLLKCFVRQLHANSITVVKEDFRVQVIETNEIKNELIIPDLEFRNVKAACFIEPHADYIAFLNDNGVVNIVQASNGDLHSSWDLPFKIAGMACHPGVPFFGVGTVGGCMIILDIRDLKSPSIVSNLKVSTHPDSRISKLAFLNRGTVLIGADVGLHRVHAQFSTPFGNFLYCGFVDVPGEVIQLNTPSSPGDMRLQLVMRHGPMDACPCFIQNYSLANYTFHLKSEQLIRGAIKSLCFSPVPNAQYAYHADTNCLGLITYSEEHQSGSIRNAYLTFEGKFQAEVNQLVIRDTKLFAFDIKGYFSSHNTPNLKMKKVTADVTVHTHFLGNYGIAEGIVSLDGSQVLCIGLDSTVVHVRIEPKPSKFSWKRFNMGSDIEGFVACQLYEYEKFKATKLVQTAESEEFQETEDNDSEIFKNALKVHHRKENAYKETQVQILKDIEEFSGLVTKLVNYNLTKQQSYRVPLKKFNLDPELDSLMEKATSNAKLIASTYVNSLNQVRVDWLNKHKKTVWDDFNTKGYMVKGFKCKMEIQNYPLAPTTTEVQNKLDHVYAQRRLELELSELEPVLQSLADEVGKKVIIKKPGRQVTDTASVQSTTETAAKEMAEAAESMDEAAFKEYVRKELDKIEKKKQERLKRQAQRDWQQTSSLNVTASFIDLSVFNRFSLFGQRETEDPSVTVVKMANTNGETASVTDTTLEMEMESENLSTVVTSADESTATVVPVPSGESDESGEGEDESPTVSPGSSAVHTETAAPVSEHKVELPIGIRPSEMATKVVESMTIKKSRAHLTLQESQSSVLELPVEESVSDMQNDLLVNILDSSGSKSQSPSAPTSTYSATSQQTQVNETLFQAESMMERKGNLKPGKADAQQLKTERQSMRRENLTEHLLLGDEVLIVDTDSSDSEDEGETTDERSRLPTSGDDVLSNIVKTRMEWFNTCTQGNSVNGLFSVSSLLYNQFVAGTNYQLCKQSAMIKCEIRKLKAQFNREFDRTRNIKATIMKESQARNSRMKHIMGYLDIQMKIPGVHWDPRENTDQVFVCLDSEVPTKMFYTDEEIAELERKRREEEELRLQRAQSFYEKHLLKIMDGKLVIRQEDILEKEIPVPYFMTVKEEWEYDAYEYFEAKAYYEKCAKLEEERVAFKKELEVELKMLMETSVKERARMDANIKDLWNLKQKVEQVVRMEEVKLARLKKMFERSLDMQAKLNILSKAVQKLQNAMKASQELSGQLVSRLEQCSEQLENVVTTEKTLEKAFRRDLGDVGNHYDYFVKSYKKRPKVNMKADKLSRMCELIISAAKSSNVRQWSQQHGDIGNMIAQAMVEYDNPIQCPSGCPRSSWERFIHLRRKKLALDFEAKQITVEMVDLKEAIRDCHSRESKVGNELAKAVAALSAQKGRQLYDSQNFEIQLRLPQGIVELSKSQVRSDFFNVSLMRVHQIQKINGTIYRLADLIMKRMDKFAKEHVNALERQWDYKATLMKVRDLKDTFDEVENLRIDSHILDFTRHAENYESVQQRRLQRANDLREFGAKTQNKFTEENSMAKKRLVTLGKHREVRMKQMQHYMDATNKDMSLKMGLFALNKQLTVGEDPTARAQAFMRLGTLTRKVHQNSQKIEALESELERQYRRTYPVL